MESEKNWQRCNAHTFWKEEASCAHVVQIYEDDNEFLDLLQGFVSGGIAAGDSVIIIASAARITALEVKLRIYGLDLDALKATDQYLPFHADEVLAKFMVDDWPNYTLFMETISGIFGRARQGNRHVRAFGEMVALLWAEGKSAATIMLEQLWNMYGEKEPFSLFCAYSAAEFPQDSTASIRNICKTHSKIITGSGNTSTELSYLNVNL